MWERYKKFVVAAIGGVIEAAAILWPGDPTAAKIVAVITIFATAFGVYQVRNDPTPPIYRG